MTNNDNDHFQLCGSCFLAIGVWLRFAAPGYATLLPDHAALSADCLFMTIGVISFVIAFFGCCGSWFQSRCFLIIVGFDCVSCFCGYNYMIFFLC